MTPHRSAIRLALFAILIATSARASQVIHLDTRGLVRESSDIVIGQVEDQSAHWNAEHTRIVTDVTVHVTQRLKGAAAERITLQQWGGEIDGLRYAIPGAPSFTRGEEALLFVWRDAQGRPQVDGLAQGKFEIRRDPATGERLVQRAADGLAVRDVRSLAMVPTGGVTPRIKLDDLVKEIQGALGEAGR
jgi:hypothetical protein